MIGRRTRLPVLAAVAWLVAGCTILLEDPLPPPSPEEIAALTEKLTALPRSEESARLLRTAVIRIAEAASAIQPGLVWAWDESRGGPGPCHDDYAHTGGVMVVLPPYRADGTFPPSAWPGFRAAAGALAAEAGAVTARPDTSTPDAPHAHFEGADGTYLGNRTELAIYGGFPGVTITAHTGCRLP